MSAVTVPAFGTLRWRIIPGLFVSARGQLVVIFEWAEAFDSLYELPSWWNLPSTLPGIGETRPAKETDP